MAKSLNEHILGDPWPTADLRLEMLEEAIEVIRLLWQGDSVTHRGKHFTVEDARIFDLPSDLPPIVVSAFAETSAELAASYGDGLWTTGVKTDVIDAYRSAGGSGPIWSQLSDPEPLVSSIKKAKDAGIDYVYLHQIGNPLRGFLDFWVDEIEPELG